MIKHARRKSPSSTKAAAKLRADRERYQREKPTPKQLMAEGGHQEFVTLGELLFLHEVMASLKKERERQGLTLAALSKRSGIDQAALSRLETGQHGNPTLATLYRIAVALGKVIVCTFQDAPAEKSAKARPTGA